MRPDGGAQFRVKLNGILRQASVLQRHWQTDAASLDSVIENLTQGTQGLIDKVADFERQESVGASSFGGRLRRLSQTLEEVQRSLRLVRAQTAEAREDTAAVARALGALMSSDFVVLYPESVDDIEAQQQAAKLAEACLETRRVLGEHLTTLTSAPTSAELQRQIEQLEQGLRDLAGPAAVLDAKFSAEIRSIRTEQQVLAERLDGVLGKGLAALREDMRQQAEAANRRHEALLGELEGIRQKQGQFAAYSRLRHNLRVVYGLVHVIRSGTTSDGSGLTGFNGMPFSGFSVSLRSLLANRAQSYHQDAADLAQIARGALSMLSSPPQQHYQGAPSLQQQQQSKVGIVTASPPFFRHV